MDKFSFSANSVNNQTPKDTLLILGYECGDILRHEHYREVYGNDPGHSFYCSEGNHKLAVADAISMLRLYCKLKGWDFEELLALGEEHYMERMVDLKMHGVRSS